MAGPAANEQVVTFTAVYGTFALMPGIFPVVVGKSPMHFDVEPLWLDSLKDQRRGIDVNGTDCTTFRVRHHGREWPETIDELIATALFDEALTAISEMLLWFKKGTQGPAAQHARQVGRVDVKFFSIAGNDEEGSRVAWLTPLRRPPQEIHGMMPRIRMENGPAASPTPPEVRRFQASVDLWNLGFFTESFVTAFALLDDLVQDVLRSGLIHHGLTARKADRQLRAIREERLRTYLTETLEQAGWLDLSVEDATLFDAVMQANGDRNDIMHGSTRLTGADALVHLGTLRDAITWLTSNPFGRAIPALPLVDVVAPEFVYLESGEPHVARWA